MVLSSSLVAILVVEFLRKKYSCNDLTSQQRAML